MDVLEQWSVRAVRLIETVENNVNLLRGEIQKNAMERALHDTKVKELAEQLSKTSVKQQGRRGNVVRCARAQLCGRSADERTWGDHRDGSDEDEAGLGGFLQGGFGGGMNRRRDKGRKRVGQ